MPRITGISSGLSIGIILSSYVHLGVSNAINWVDIDGILREVPENDERLL
jgi:hypothetical protein